MLSDIDGESLKHFLILFIPTTTVKKSILVSTQIE